MKKIILIFGMIWGLSAIAATVTSVDFRVDGGTSWIEITSDSPVTYTQSENSQDKQLILNFDQSTIGPAASRRLDTSSFDSPVLLVSPYQVDGQSRIVVQMREMSPATITQDGNVIRVAVNAGPAPLTPAAPEAQAQAAEQPVAPGAEPPAAPAEPSEPAPETVAEKKPEPTILEKFDTSRQTNQFKGTPITLQVRDADVTDVLRLIGEASGFNIVVGEGVEGKITLSLVDVPWDQALDVVLNTMKLGAERKNNILRVATLSNLTSEKQEILKAKQAAEASAPRITRVFSISYADPSSLEKLVTTFGKSNASAGGPAPVVQLDPRTNSIVVQDIPENIDRMAKLIEILDTQTPQVMIEAKIVEATEQFSRTIGGSLGVSGDNLVHTAKNTYPFFASFGGANPSDQLIGSPGAFSNGTAVGTASQSSGLVGISPRLSFLPGVQRLNAFLAMGETEQTVKVVSSPKIVVLNKEASSILQSQPVIIESTVNDGGVTTTQKQILQANIGLKVTPTVTNDGSVMMKLDITRDIPTSAGDEQAVANRNMQTSVLVDSGSTLVIGGVYIMDKQNSEGGFPFLRKIPILGTFFGSSSENNVRSELFIFITPTILNTKQAGLSG